MPDIREALADRGIRLRHYQPGEHRARCPECARPPRRPDDALAVKVDPDGGATWVCHRCAWTCGIGPTITAWRSDRRTRPAPEQQPEPEPHEHHETLAPWGVRLWGSCKPIEPGTVAARYLEGRRCALPPFPDKTHLRWHPALADRMSGYTGPALVALVTNAETGEAINLHRTWLAPDGTGKAPIDKPRRLLKSHRSRGVIRLWPDSEVTLGITVGEGVETCLAAASEALLPVWATISATNLASFPVLPGIEGITILCDHDLCNPQTGRRAGHEATLQLIKRYTEAGFDPKHDIKVIMSPTEGEDVNDLVRKLRGAG